MPFADPAARAAYVKRHREENRERYVQAQRRYRQRNLERVRAANRTYANSARGTATQRAWAERNAERAREIGRRASAMRYARTAAVPIGDAEELAEYSLILRGDPCSYCDGLSAEDDHIDSIRYGGSHEMSNFTAACKSCNSSKNDRPLLIFLLRRRGA